MKYLRANHRSITLTDTAELLGIPEEAIQAYYRSVGLELLDIDNFTLEDIDFIKKNINKLSTKVIAHKLGVSNIRVLQKAKALGIRTKTVSSMPKSGLPRYRDFILRNQNTMTVTEMSVALELPNFVILEIIGSMKKDGVITEPVRKRRYTTEEDNLIRSLYRSKGAEHLSGLLNRSVTSIQTRASRLGVAGS